MQSLENARIRQYAALVRRLATRMLVRLPGNVELEDLVQAGMIGLLDAVRRYREMPEAQFETYASTRIRGAMIDELRNQDWLPRSARSKAREIERVVATLVRTLGRAPAESEIAGALDVSLPAYRAMLDDAQGVQVLHAEDILPETNREELMPAPVGRKVSDAAAWSDNPLAELLSAGLRQALITAVSRLPEREKQLLSLQFEHDLTQKEIARVMSLTEGRVSQLRSQAILRIRAELGRHGWHGESYDEVIKGGVELFPAGAGRALP